jgi:hypothetical protein
MAAKKKLTQDIDTPEIRFNRELKQMTKDVIWYPEPTRTFEVGEEVICGAHKQVTILQSFEGGKFYNLDVVSTDNNYGRPFDVKSRQLQFWTNIFKKGSWTREGEIFTVDDRLNIQYFNSSIESLLFQSYRGMNFNPDYQRELVWSYEDKVSLLDSIFNVIDIGKISVIALDYMKEGFDFNKDFHYEILDGKQRLNTLREFYEDRLVYRGRKYSELNIEDRYHFDRYPISKGEVREPKDRSDIYRYFLKLNTGGKPMPQSQIEKVRNLIK